MKEFKTFNDLKYNIHLIPEAVALDVMMRINDWMLSGGNLNDSYISSQLQYASKFINK